MDARGELPPGFDHNKYDFYGNILPTDGVETAIYQLRVRQINAQPYVNYPLIVSEENMPCLVFLNF